MVVGKQRLAVHPVDGHAVFEMVFQDVRRHRRKRFIGGILLGGFPLIGQPQVERLDVGRQDRLQGISDAFSDAAPHQPSDVHRHAQQDRDDHQTGPGGQ